MVALPVRNGKSQQVSRHVEPVKSTGGTPPMVAPVASGREKLRAEIVAAVEQALDSSEAEALLAQLGGDKGGLDERERCLLNLRQLVGAAMAAAALNRGRGYTGTRRGCRCGRTARYIRDDGKRYVTLVGEVELQRAEYRCPQCGSFRPLDEEWDLPEGHFTRGVIRLAATLGAALPFERAAEALGELCGLGMSASQLRQVCERVGETIGQQQATAVEQSLSGALQPPAAPAVLVVGVDGAHVNTREGGWKETKVGVAARYEWQVCDEQEALQQTAVDYTALVGPPEPFGQHLYALAQRMGGRGREATIVLGDGAPWIWNLVAEHLPDAIQVLDFYHLAEHVHAMARALRGDNESAAREWAETVLVLLRAGETEAAVEYLRRSGEVTEVLLAYIDRNRERMPYPWLEEHGYPIGSGIVESACKQIVHTRHRQAGMRWRQEHVQKMLNLSCCLRGRRWPDFWASRPKVA